MNLKRQSTVLLGGNMKIKIMLKYLYVLCFVFCFFAPQSFAFDATQYCEQETARLNKKYNDMSQQLQNDKLQKLIDTGSCRCEKFLSENQTQIECRLICFNTGIVPALLEELEGRIELLNILKEDEFKTVNWVCQNK
jgi:hypothetical protein